MLPTVTHVQAQLHAEELHRQAAAHRAAAAMTFRPASPTAPTLRARIGATLVRMGARLQGLSEASPASGATTAPIGDCA